MPLTSHERSTVHHEHTNEAAGLMNFLSRRTSKAFTVICTQLRLPFFFFSFDLFLASMEFRAYIF